VHGTVRKPPRGLHMPTRGVGAAGAPVCSTPQLGCRGCPLSSEPGGDPVRSGQAEVPKVMEEVRGWLLAGSNPGLPLLSPLPGLSSTNIHASFVLIIKLTPLFLEFLCNSPLTAYCS